MVPPLDVWETDTEVVYAFDLPGLEEERISIEVQDDTLTVSGDGTEVSENGDRFFRFERRYGSFSRAAGLPQGVDETKINAAYSNGVLEVRVPKPEETKPRRIQLGAAHADVGRASDRTRENCDDRRRPQWPPPPFRRAWEPVTGFRTTFSESPQTRTHR